MINPTYIDEKNIIPIRKAFLANSPRSIQLQDFMANVTWHMLQSECSHLEWTHNALYDEYNFLEAQLTPTMTRLLCSPELLRLIQTITQRKIKKVDAKLCAFDKGSYTLLLDKYRMINRTYMEIELTKEWDVQWDGYTSFVDKEEILRVSPTPKSLVLVDQGRAQRFIKYVNHNAQAKRIFIQGMIR